MGIGFAGPGLRIIDGPQEFHLELFSHEAHWALRAEPVLSLYWFDTGQ